MNSAEQSGGDKYGLTGQPLPDPAPPAPTGPATSHRQPATRFIRPLAVAGLALVAIAASFALPEWRQVLVGTSVGLLAALLVIGRPHPAQALSTPGTPARENEADWHEAMNALPDGLARWDARGKLLGANQAMLDLLGLTLSELEDAALESRFADSCQNMTRLEPTGLTRSGVRFEIVRDQKPTLELTLYQLADKSEVGTVRDISRHKKLAAALDSAKREHGELVRCLTEERAKAEAASRSKTAFLAHLSHDIRTPLNHIIGFADLIQHQPYGPIGDRRYASYIGDIKSSGDRLLNSFSQILELAEMEAGNTPMRHEKILAADLFARLADRFGERARKTGVELHIALPAEFSLEGDSHCLLRMMGNLVDNALKFTRSGGRVSLAAWAAEDGVVLEVSDTGTGITQSRLALLAEPHLIGEAAFDVQNGMPGFGLAIARGIAELSGGSLVIDSTPMVGTTVAVALPRTLSRTLARTLAENARSVAA